MIFVDQSPPFHGSQLTEWPIKLNTCTSLPWRLQFWNYLCSPSISATTHGEFQLWHQCSNDEWRLAEQLEAPCSTNLPFQRWGKGVLKVSTCPGISHFWWDLDNQCYTWTPQPFQGNYGFNEGVAGHITVRVRAARYPNLEVDKKNYDLIRTQSNPTASGLILSWASEFY